MNLLSHVDQPLISSSIKMILFFLYLLRYGALFYQVCSPCVCLEHVIISLNNISTDKFSGVTFVLLFARCHLYKTCTAEILCVC